MEYLLFEQEKHLFAVKAIAVQEILWMPALTEVQSDSREVVGALNYRGDIILILDLLKKDESKEYNFHSTLLVLRAANQLFGILVEKALHLEEISPENIRSIEESDEVAISSIKKVAIQGSTIIGLIDVDNIVEKAIENQEISMDSARIIEQFSGDQLKALQDRANRASLTLEQELTVDNELNSFALFMIGGEKYALNLEYVQEFVSYETVAMVPGTSEFILGNINLRGTIITVVSLDHLLEIEASNQKQKESHRSILINYKGTRFIIQTELIDEVQDIKESLIEPVSEDSNSVGRYISGYLRLEDKLIGIISLKDLVKETVLITNQS